MMTDLRYALRRLVKSPGFTATAILTLGIGIGACTAIFSVVNGVLLRPLAFPQPQQLVRLRETMPALGPDPLPVNAHHFLAWRERATSFDGLSIVDPHTSILTGVSQPEQLGLVDVSANFFELLGKPPALGRSFLPEEETAGRQHVVVISDALWHRNFAADPGLVGRAILLDGAPHTVVGVLPADFRFPQTRDRIGGRGPANADVFSPKVFLPDELLDLLGRHNYGTIARLKPGVTLQQAETELNGLGAQIVREAGQPNAVLRAIVVPLYEAIVGQSRRGLLVLFAAVTSVLLIACINLMNFLLAQAERRRQESAVRQALGASRAQLLRAALVETLLVAVAGGLLGIAIAHDGLAFLIQYAPADFPRLAEVQVDPSVLLFALAITLATGLLFGLAPAWRLAYSDPQQALCAGSRTLTGGVRGRRWSDTLVATEVALSVVLLALAALLGGSFARLLRTEQGFRAPTVLTAKVVIPFAKYSEAGQRLAFFEQLVDHLAATPGIATAAVVSTLPLQGENWVDKAAVAGDPRPDGEKPNVNIRFISPAYFQTIGLPLRAGRSFDARDHSRKVMIVSEQLARLLWPGQDPVGRRLERIPGEEYEVIGVAGDVRVSADRTPVPTAYRPYWDWPPLGMIVAARAAGDARAAGSAIRAAIQSVDRDVPIPAFHTMDDVLGESVAQQRFQMLLAGVFAAAALLLSALGIYGVVAYSVARRQKELGIRIALGATPTAIHALVLRHGMRPVLFGLVVGLATALAGGRVLNSLLFETRASDPFTLAMVAATLTLIALGACYLPGRHATHVNPVEALRAE